MPRGSGSLLRRKTAPVLALALVLLVAGGGLPAASGNGPRPATPGADAVRTSDSPRTERPTGSTTRPAAPVRAQQAGDKGGPDGSQKQWVLTFSDEFNGNSLDKEKWSNGFGWGQETRSDYGWCDPGNNVVSGGVLAQRINRKPQGGQPFSVGCIHSKNKFAQQFGYWEARIRAARCYGARTAFWGKPNDESWPPELDVVEVNGDGPDRANRAKFTVHWRGGGRHLQSQGEYAGPDFSDDYHVFGAEWTPEGTTWFVDGVKRWHTAAGAAAMDDGGSFYTILNSQVILRNSMCGDIPARSASYVDWVRVWTPAPIEAEPPVGPPEDGAPKGAECRFPARVQAEAQLPSGNGEASGAVASQRFDGVGWFIRDSGNPASLYSFRWSNGRHHVREVRVTGAANRDWEDLVYTLGPDGRGRLFIIESGQSGGDRFIYEVPEPNPDAGRTAPAKKYRYAFPDLRNANTESAFTVGRHLALVTKTSPGRIYRFDELSEGSVNRGRYMGQLVDANRVSVVRLSGDRRTVVAASHTQAWVYEGLPPATPLRGVAGKKPNRITKIDEGVNVEAGDWFPNGSCQLLLLAENRNTYRLRLGQPPGGETRASLD
ncbi:MAG TPA: glycoside hydrolase family 16 protein [Acidimicrobiia bacterium]|nr:glycoside hydrolase family 16 protein [Acidimicrobiia bacterium]